MSQIGSTLLGGLTGGTILFVLTALCVRLPAVRRRPALVCAMWLVVLARFVLPIPIAGGFSIEAQIASAFGNSAWVFPAPELAAISTAGPSGGGGLTVGLALLYVWAFISALLVLLTARASIATRRRLSLLAPASGLVLARAELLTLVTDHMALDPDPAEPVVQQTQFSARLDFHDIHGLVLFRLGVVVDLGSSDADLVTFEVHVFDEIGVALMKVDGAFVSVAKGPFLFDGPELLSRVDLEDREGGAAR